MCGSMDRLIRPASSAPRNRTFTEIGCAIRYENERDKVVWILVIVLAGIVGALIYLFARRVPRRRTIG